jgi:hypothetical protein
VGVVVDGIVGHKVRGGVVGGECVRWNALRVLGKSEMTVLQCAADRTLLKLGLPCYSTTFWQCYQFLLHAVVIVGSCSLLNPPGLSGMFAWHLKLMSTSLCRHTKSHLCAS